jgi:hypothetical protein
VDRRIDEMEMGQPYPPPLAGGGRHAVPPGSAVEVQRLRPEDPCPACGQRLRPEIWREWWFWVLMLIIVAVIMGNLARI